MNKYEIIDKDTHERKQVQSDKTIAEFVAERFPGADIIDGDTATMVYYMDGKGPNKYGFVVRAIA